MTGELSFFEIGVGDVEKGRAFYGELFGWDFAHEGQGLSIATPNITGGVHGGDPGASPYLFFRVDDIDTAADRVRELGGEANPVPGESDSESEARYGRFMLCRDDQGSSFGLHEPPAG